MEDEILKKLEALEDSLKKRNSLREWVALIFEKILIPVTLVIVTFMTYFTNTRLSEQQVELHDKQLQMTNKQIEFEQKYNNQLLVNSDRELDIMYLNLFYEELSKPGSDKENTLDLLGLLNDDLRVTLADWVKKSDQYDDKTRQKAASIISELDDLSKFTISIYYNPTLAGHELKAKTIYKSLVSKNVDFSIRLSPQKQSFFDKYPKALSNEVRFERAFETKASNELIGLLQSTSPNLNFVAKPVSNRTINFMSIFLKD